MLLCSLYYSIPNNNIKNSKRAKESKRAPATKSGFVQKPVSKKKKTRKHKGMLGDAGSAVGTFFGNAGVGRTVGNLIGDIFGWGDYDAEAPLNMVAINSITGDSFSNQQPMLHNGDGYARIQHREFIRDLDLYDVFDPLTFLLNPTNTSVFPWLSNVARNYEMYKFRGVVIGYRGQGTTFSETGSLGSISLATQYDVQDLHFTSKAEMLSTLFCTSCKPSDSMMHAIECDPAKTPVAPLYSGINEVTIKNETLSSNSLGLDLTNLPVIFDLVPYQGDSHLALVSMSYDMAGILAVGDTLTATAMVTFGTADPQTTLMWISRKVVAVNIVSAASQAHEIILEGGNPGNNGMYDLSGARLIELTRSRAVPNRDSRLNDFARVTLSAQGATPATKIGELWISYDVEFFKPSIRIGEELPVAPNSSQIGDIHRTKLRLGPEYDDCKFVVSGDVDPKYPHPAYVPVPVAKPSPQEQVYTHVRHPSTLS